MQHPLRNDEKEGYTDSLNLFDEQVFAHNTNGTILAIRPEHITLSQSRRLGSIPAVVEDWVGIENGYQVMLAVKDRARAIIFRVNLPADQTPRIILHKEMILYMIFQWDKLIEYRAEREPRLVQPSL
jgi:hypothetical protein